MRSRVTLATLIAALALGGVAWGGYDPSGGDDEEYGGGGGDTAKVDLTLTAKKKQKSLKAVKVKATCEGRACMVEARGKLRAGGKRAKLKGDDEALAEGETETLKLKLAKKAKRTAKSAARDDEKLKVKVSARAKGVGGGGSDKDSVKVKLKP